MKNDFQCVDAECPQCFMHWNPENKETRGQRRESMRKWLLATLGIMTLIGATLSSVQAETLLGKNYIGGSFGIVKFGDDELDEVLGTGYGFDAGGNINLNPNIDLQLYVAYAWADGETEGIEIDISGRGGGADLIYFFKPEERVNPYIGAGFALIKSEVEVSGFGETEGEDDTEVGYGAEIGVELEFTEHVLFNFSLDYFNIDDEDGVDINVSVGYWFNEQMLGGIGGSYDFDDEDASVSIGLIVKL